MRALVPLAAAAAFTLAGGPTDPLKFDDVHLPTGVRLHYAEQGDPAAHPLILLHGYSDSWFSYSGVLTGLARSYHVYALDQRGHGDPDRPATGYAMADLAADVIAFMDVKGIERATIVGHSMGSFVARQVVAAAPERVARLVLVPSTTAPVASLGRGGIPTLIFWGDRDSGFHRSEQPAEFVRDLDASLARASSTGQDYISSSPSGRLSPSERTWPGLRTFSRRWATRRWSGSASSRHRVSTSSSRSRPSILSDP